MLRVGLCHVLRNLLANAAHATAEAEADPARRRIIVAVSSAEDTAEISVTDNGPGFPDAVLARLGEPFQTTKGDDGGLGLGLYVCATLAGRLGGSLRAENCHGGGARVVLTVTRRLDTALVPAVPMPSSEARSP